MKTTENISLGGYAFTIETDACNELERYINEIRSGFSTDPSAEEIIADIEERIAELLKEHTVPGMVVNLPMIREIESRIGNPKELAQDEPERNEEQAEKQSADNRPKKVEKKTWKSRRMYRDIDNRVFGGVCSGLGAYFEIDSVLVRIIFLIMFVIGLIGIDDGPYILLSVVLYICLWIAMPAARTDEQKREMHGRPTDLKGYKGKEFEFKREVKEAVQSPAGQTLTRAGRIFLGILLLLAGLGGLLVGFFIPKMPEVIGNHLQDHIMRWGALDAERQLMADLLGGTTFWGLVLVMLGIGCIGIIYGAIMLLFDLKAPAWKPGLIVFIAWIISIFLIIGWVVMKVADALPGLIG